MRLPVVWLDPFYDSLLELDDSPETQRALSVLLSDAENHPEATPTMYGMDLRVLYTDPGQGLALMRLFFWVEDGKLYIMHVERCS